LLASLAIFLLVAPLSGAAAGGSRATAQVSLSASIASPRAVAGSQSAVDVQALDAYFAKAQRDWGVPGMAVAIVKDGEVVLASGYGVRDLTSGGEVDADTMFAIASNSKAFTAAALAMLVDEGKLNWDDPVRKYIPHFQVYDPYVSAEMRVYDLLSHRSGLGSFSGDLLWYASEYDAEEVVRRTRYVPQAGPFRASYGYSNLMFVAAGQIIPAVTGQSWSEFVRARIIDPLGMDRTVTSTSDLGRFDNVATPHAEPEGELRAYPWRGWDAMAAGGGIISSVADMTTWIKLQLNRGELDGRRFFTEQASRTMWTPLTSMTVSAGSERHYPSTHFRAYGMGWSLMDYLGRRIVSHGGAYDGMYSRVVLVPEERLGLVVLTNSTTGISSALMYRVLDAYLGGEERDWAGERLADEKRAKRAFVERQEKIWSEQVEGTRPSLPLERYAGTYGGPMYGDAAVTVEGDGLVLRFLPSPELVGDLTHLHYDTFVVKWRNDFPWFGIGTVQFVLDAAADVVEMKVEVPNDDFWFYELEFKRR
jgi:CubicO group peptidase (beta-lactamase class C family)